MYTIVYNLVQIFKKEILKHGVQNFHVLTLECVKYNVFNLFVDFMDEKYLQSYIEAI